MAATVTQVTPGQRRRLHRHHQRRHRQWHVGLNLVDNGSIRDLAGNPLTQQNAQAAFQAAADLCHTVLTPTDGVVRWRWAISTGVTAIPTSSSQWIQRSTVSVLLGNGNGTLPDSANLRHWSWTQFQWRLAM